MDSTDPRDTTIIGKATDGELFALMAERGPAGKEAWAEIYQRYVGDLYKIVSRLEGVPQPLIEELVQETMIKAFKSASTFKEGDVSDAIAARRRTLAWLGSIANRTHLSMLRQRRGVIVGSLPQENGEDDSQWSTKGRRLFPGELHREIRDTEDVVSGCVDDDHISPTMRLLCDALDSLTDKEQEILRVTFQYQQLGQKQQRLSSADVKEICERYSISHDYPRQLKKRALKKIKKYVDAHAKKDRTS